MHGRAILVALLLMTAMAPVAMAQSCAPGYGDSKDSDCDGFPDNVEQAAGSDPNDADSQPEIDITADVELILNDDGSITLIITHPGGSVQFFVIWVSNSPWRILTTVEPAEGSDVTMFTVSDSVEGTKYKVTANYDSTVPAGTEQIPDWDADMYALVQSGSSSGSGSGSGSDGGSDGGSTTDGSSGSDYSGSSTGGSGAGTETDTGSSDGGLPTWFYIVLGILGALAIGLLVALILVNGRNTAAAA